MNVTLETASNVTRVSVKQYEQYMTIEEIDRAVEQLRVARRWLVKDRAMRGLETKGA